MVAQQDLTDPSVRDQNQDVLADGTSAEKDVPYYELKKATDAKKTAEEGRLYAERQLELYQANAMDLTRRPTDSISYETRWSRFNCDSFSMARLSVGAM